MDFIRRGIITFAVLLLSTLVYAEPIVPTNEGIVFIHGTRDHREDAYGDYWKLDFLESMSKGLAKPENMYVVHCDFSQYMWHEEAAFCVTNQMLDFINEKQITSLTVYTHSDGGNVIRWILSNPTYDPKFLTLKNKIQQIIAIAPSSGGTVLADEVLSGGMVETSVAWLLGYLSDAVRQQRVGDMLIYNDELLLGSRGRPALSTPFKVIVGTDVIASPFKESSYCNGIVLNTGLKIAQLYLDSCSDGFLDCTSQTAAGETWFNDIDKTDGAQPLSHNQSRHTCFGFDTILKSVFATEGAAK